MKRIVLIADIVSSREIKDRDRIQKKLKVTLQGINQTSHSMLSPMTITLGDEFQCVYSNADEIFKHIWKILYASYPEKIRFSFGIGKITTGINRSQAIGMDGPAFYEAREGLEWLKQHDYFFNITSSNDSEMVSFTRNALFLVSHNIEGWNRNRIRIMNLLTEGTQVRSIVKMLGISEQAVYKNIRSGGLEVILDLTKNIAGALNNMVKN
jgi:hypothetical protein